MVTDVFVRLVFMAAIVNVSIFAYLFMSSIH